MVVVVVAMCGVALERRSRTASSIRFIRRYPICRRIVRPAKDDELGFPWLIVEVRVERPGRTVENGAVLDVDDRIGRVTPSVVVEDVVLDLVPRSSRIPIEAIKANHAVATGVVDEVVVQNLHVRNRVDRSAGGIQPEELRIRIDCRDDAKDVVIEPNVVRVVIRIAIEVEHRISHIYKLIAVYLQV